jgi:hypothetical protein
VSALPQPTRRPPEKGDARNILRRWFRNHSKGRTEFDVADEVVAATRALRNDPVFLDAVVHEAVALLLPQIIGNSLSRDRRMARLGEKFVSKEYLEAVIFDRLSRHWFENVGGSVHKAITECTKPELRYAREQREARVKTEMKVIAFEQRLEDGLPDNVTKVGDHYDASALANIWRVTIGPA